MNAATIIPLSILVIVAANVFLLPYFTPRRFFFTITVPIGFPVSEAGRSIMRVYHLQVAGLIAASILVAVEVPGDPAWGEVLFALGAGAAFLYTRSKASRYSTMPETVREADLRPAEEPLPRWILLSLPPFLFVAAAAAWLRAHWREIPERFPYHWAYNGEPNRWAVRSERAVYGPLLFCAAMMLLILSIGLATFYGSRRSEQRLATLKLIVAGIYCISTIFVGIAVMPVMHFPLWLFGPPIILFIGGAMIWQYKFLNDPERRAEATPDACWHLGQIYYNPQDPAIFVQKRLGLGYTVNFGNRISWVLLAVVLAALGGMIFLLPRSA
jgi:uncharacterized membrane protein